MSESGDRTERSTDDVALIDALSAVASAGSGVASRPGQLLTRLEAELGEAAERNRGRVRQLVVGAEEHVPARLVGLAPLSPAALDRVAAELAQVRGWTAEVASWVVTSWATALGLSSVAQRPAVSVDPGSPISDPRVAGVRIPDGDTSVAAQPPQVSVHPPVLPRLPSAATPGPAPAPPGHSLQGMPSPRRDSGSRRSRAAGYPQPRGQSIAFSGPPVEPVLAVAAVLAAAVITALSVVVNHTGRWLVIGGYIVMCLIISRLWRYAIVLAYDDGLVVVGTKSQRGPVRPETREDFGWDQVTVRTGYIPRLTVPGHTWQMTPGARKFVRAAGEHADAVRVGALPHPSDRR